MTPYSSLPLPPPLAWPAGKKVVDQGGGQLWCEAEQRFVEHAEQRYLFRAVVADHTGSEIINIFNAQVGRRAVAGWQPNLTCTALLHPCRP